MFIQSDGVKLAIAIDAVIEKQEVIVKVFEGILKRVRNVSGATILDSGEICIVLNPKDLVKTILHKNISVIVEEIPTTETVLKKILVVDDSLTTRVQIKRILETEGFSVDLGVDGEDWWNKLNSGEYGLVVSDMEMPKMNGLEFTKKIIMYNF